MKTLQISPKIEWSYFVNHVQKHGSAGLNIRVELAYKNQAQRDIQAAILRFKRRQSIDF